MASTHTLYTSIAAATSNAAGGTTTGTTVDLTTAYGGILTAKMTNGGTGPTVAAYIALQVSGDNTNFKEAIRFTGNTTASSVSEFFWNIPPGTMYIRAYVAGNTGQAVTVEAFVQALTTI